MDIKKKLGAFLVGDIKPENKPDQSSNPNDDPGAEEIYRQRESEVNERALQDFKKIVEMEIIIVEDLVKPLIFLFNHFLPFHDTIRYDPVARSCVPRKGSLLRKFICIFWQLLIIYRLAIKAIPSLNEENEMESGNGADISVLAKGAFFTFITFSCVAFYVYTLKTSKICAIFNQVILLAEKLHLQNRSPSRMRIVKVAVHGSWIYATLYIILTVVIYTFDMLSTDSISNADSSSSKGLLNTSSNIGKGSKYHLGFTDIHVSDEFIILQIITTMGSFINIFNWMLTYFHLGVWGLLFRQLITVFYWKIQTKRELGQNFVIPQEIRTFNKIGSLIDEFNNIYSTSCLFGAVVCITYISPSIKHAFSGLTGMPHIGSGLHLLLSYVPMIVTTFMIAEVSRIAGSFAGIIKNEYGRFTKECGDTAESLCGIAILHYDLVTSNIGFKGLGFFTVSYQFVTTIVSVIISYSILVLQLFPHDNTDVEV